MSNRMFANNPELTRLLQIVNTVRVPGSIPPRKFENVLRGLNSILKKYPNYEMHRDNGFHIQSKIAAAKRTWTEWQRTKNLLVETHRIPWPANGDKQNSMTLNKISKWPGNSAIEVNDGRRKNYFTRNSFNQYFGRGWKTMSPTSNLPIHNVRKHPETRELIKRKWVRPVTFTGSKPVGTPVKPDKRQNHNSNSNSNSNSKSNGKRPRVT